jgi:hypothetical protein
MSATQPLITLSVVSHGQAALIGNLLSDLVNVSPQNFEIVVTLNVPEPTEVYEHSQYAMNIIRNSGPRGFGANHNAAFAQARGKFFAVVNPDIRIRSLNILRLLCPFDDPATCIVAPMVLSKDGRIEDSARRFPTVRRLVRRVLHRQRGPDYRWADVPIGVDWVAGMFMVFRREAFSALKGFDARRFFMYMEDADICRRARLHGWSVILQPRESVVHDAQRASRRNLKHMRWHVISAFRYLSGL